LLQFTVVALLILLQDELSYAKFEGLYIINYFGLGLISAGGARLHEAGISYL
jgi:hypothetical protein